METPPGLLSHSTENAVPQNISVKTSPLSFCFPFFTSVAPQIFGPIEYSAISLSCRTG